jgi:hypothetical protein
MYQITNDNSIFRKEGIVIIYMPLTLKIEILFL